MDPILSAENISAGYRDRRILHEVTLHAHQGEKVLLIGPNGCGKTTLLKVLAGMLRPVEGRIIFKNKDLTQIFGHQRTRLGIGYLMQTRNIFNSLTVEDNLDLSLWRGSSDYDKQRHWILNIFPILKKNLNRSAGYLSGGERQALAIGMVLMRPVEVLLLDEPTAGLSPKAAATILEALQEAQLGAKFSTVIVEHNLKLVHNMVSRVLVMNQGRIIAEEQDPNDLLDHNNLQKYYFK